MGLVFSSTFFFCLIGDIRFRPWLELDLNLCSSIGSNWTELSVAYLIIDVFMDLWTSESQLCSSNPIQTWTKAWAGHTPFQTWAAEWPSWSLSSFLVSLSLFFISWKEHMHSPHWNKVVLSIYTYQQLLTKQKKKKIHTTSNINWIISGLVIADH